MCGVSLTDSWQCSGDGLAVMTVVIWMLTWLPQVLAAMNELPPPDNVKVNSSHFIHLLTWEPGPGTPREAHYRVKVLSAKDNSWELVAGCEHVQHPLVCNLTEAFPDPGHSYYSSVTAVLGDQDSEPAYYEDFVPIRDTQLDPPLLTVTPCDKFLCVGLHPPVERLREIYNSFHYTLKIKSNSTGAAQILKATRSLEGEILENVAPGRQYCVSIQLSDSLHRASNYSQPQCAFTNGIRTADPEISAGLCLLVVLALVILALLVQTGFICLRGSLPLILTSIQHMEEVLVTAPCRTSSSDPVHIEPTPSSTGAKGNSTSDDSDEETEGESTGGSGGGYNLRAATNLLSASSSSSSSLPSPLSPELAWPPNPGPKLPFDSFTLDSDHSHLSPLSVSEERQPEALISANIQFIAGLDHALTTRTTSQTADALPKWDQRDFGLHSQTDTFEGIKPKDEEQEEEEEVGERSGQGVNLFSITLGGREEEEEEKADVEMPQGETTCPFDREESLYSAAPLLPSQTVDTEEVAMKTASTFAEEEEEEEEEEVDECSGYLRRQCN